MTFDELCAAAQAGDTDAQFELGFCYFLGTGVPKDPTKAAKWFEKAAESRHIKAQIFLGLLYYQGNGVPKSKEEAMKWWRTVLEQGNAEDERLLKGVFFKYNVIL